MANEDLSKAEKSQLYGQTLHKFKTNGSSKSFRRNISFSQFAPRSSKMNQLVIESVPTTMKRKAQLLVFLLKIAQTCHRKMMVPLNFMAKYIPGSNIIDLVNDVIRH